MIVASELKAGMALRLEGQVFKVLHSESKAGGGQTAGVVKSVLQNVVSGREWERRFHPSERLDDLPIERHNMEFLYTDNDSCIFMDPNSFEQFAVPRTVIGKREVFLQAGMNLPVEFCGDQAISVLLPDVAEAKIKQTASPQHAQQDSTWKEAVLENGMQILVPLFVAPGELVRIDTRTGKYLERVRLERKKSA